MFDFENTLSKILSCKLYFCSHLVMFFIFFFALDIVPTGDVCPKCFSFPEIVMVMINW